MGAQRAARGIRIFQAKRVVRLNLKAIQKRSQRGRSDLLDV